MGSVVETCEGFEWDDGNSNKNWHRHRVTDKESEEVFSNVPIGVARDKLHSMTETRYSVRGITDSGRLLTVIFTIRNRSIRVVSARDMTRREERIYEEKTKRDS